METVTFVVGSEVISIPNPAAVALATYLRLRGTGAHGEYGVTGAKSVADAIEAVVVGATDNPIDVASREALDAVYHTLDFQLFFESDDDLFLLYHAVRGHRDSSAASP